MSSAPTSSVTARWSANSACAVSTPNEQLIRRGFTAFSEGRFQDCLETLHPEIEWHIAFRLPDLPPDRTIVRGHDEVLALWEQFRSVWTRLVFEPEEIVEDDGESAIARIHVEATAAESGVGVERTIYYLMQVRHELLARIVPFDSLEEARAAAAAARG